MECTSFSKKNPIDLAHSLFIATISWIFKTFESVSRSKIPNPPKDFGKEKSVPGHECSFFRSTMDFAKKFSLNVVNLI